MSRPQQTPSTTPTQAPDAEIQLIKMKVERLENHKELFKKKLEDIGDDVKDVKKAILGSGLSGEEGLVNKIKRLEVEVEELETFKTELSVYIGQSKFLIGALVVAVIGLIVKSFV